MSRTPRGSGDRFQLLEVLWAPSTRVGRSGATVGAIIEAAIDLADGAGLEAMTMRSVAERVGVGAMTLYGYVPGKAELLELMLDRVAGARSEEHTSELQSRQYLVCRILLEKKLFANE